MEPKTHNQQVAWSFFELLSEKRLEEAFSVLNEAGTWWESQGRREYGMKRHREAVAQAWSVVPMSFTLVSALEAADKVVLEMTSRATAPSGEVYKNVYCFIIQLLDDTILHVREYADTAYVNKMIPSSVTSLFREAPRA
jgi:ketosteroid isomerase-like protein